MTETLQDKLERRMLANRPADPKNDWGWKLLRRAALEGGVTVWTPNLEAAAAGEALTQPGIWTTIGLLGDITTYYSPGTPENLLEAHFTKVSRTATSMTWFAGSVLFTSGFVVWVVHPATLLTQAERWLYGGDWLQMPLLAIGMAGLSIVTEIGRRIVVWRVRRWLP